MIRKSMYYSFVSVGMVVLGCIVLSGCAGKEKEGALPVMPRMCDSSLPDFVYSEEDCEIIRGTSLMPAEGDNLFPACRVVSKEQQIASGFRRNVGEEYQSTIYRKFEEILPLRFRDWKYPKLEIMLTPRSEDFPFEVYPSGFSEIVGPNPQKIDYSWSLEMDGTLLNIKRCVETEKDKYGYCEIHFVITLNKRGELLANEALLGDWLYHVKQDN